ncbi:hypothetical protein [Aeromonas caviae]|jgi:hypothetical protein|uniref:hypothetical protein n=1 Tax=Aeromonas caviae TaxID=648 RepID=UPI00385BBD42
MESKIWTVVRFPAGVWSGGGSRNSPDYSECEVYLAHADSFDKAKKKAQSNRARLVKKGSTLPTQAAPYYCDTESALPKNANPV